MIEMSPKTLRLRMAVLLGLMVPLWGAAAEPWDWGDALASKLSGDWRKAQEDRVALAAELRHLPEVSILDYSGPRGFRTDDTPGPKHPFYYDRWLQVHWKNAEVVDLVALVPARQFDEHGIDPNFELPEDFRVVLVDEEGKTLKVPVKVFAPASVRSPSPILFKFTFVPLMIPFAVSVRPPATFHDWFAASAINASSTRFCDAALISIPPAPSVSVFPPPMVISPPGVVIFNPRIEKFAPSVVVRFAVAPASNTAKSAATGATPPTQFPPVLHTASAAPFHEMFAADAFTANNAANGTAQIRRLR